MKHEKTLNQKLRLLNIQKRESEMLLIEFFPNELNHFKNTDSYRVKEIIVDWKNSIENYIECLNMIDIQTVINIQSEIDKNNNL